MPSTPDAEELELRRAVETAALAYEPPADLAERTLALALVTADPSRADRVRARLDARRAPRPRTGAPWLGLAGVAAGVALAVAVGLGSDAPPADEVAFPATTVFPTTTAGPTTNAVPAAGSGTSVGVDVAPDGDGVQSIHQRSAFDEAPPAAAPSPAPVTGAARKEAADVGVPAVGAPAATGPPVVRTATVEVRVATGRFEQRWREADAVAARRGGFVTESSAEQVRGRLARGTLTLRVPAASLAAALGDLRALGTPVRVSTSATDVSGQVVDFDARLRAAQVNEAQLLDLLRQSRTVQDGLVVRARLADVRAEIEGLDGQRARLRDQVDLATITATVYEATAGPGPPASTDGRLARSWHRAGDAAAAAVGGMLVVAGWTGPFVLLAAGALTVLHLRRRLR